MTNTPYRSDFSDIGGRLGKALGDTQDEILRERGIDIYGGAIDDDEDYLNPADFGLVDTTQQQRQQPSFRPAPPTPAPQPPLSATPLGALAQQYKGRAPELGGYTATRTPTPTAIAPTPTPTAPVVVDESSDAQPLEQQVTPPIEQQLQNLNESLQSNNDGTYGQPLPSNPQLKTQERGTSYEPISTEDAWNDKDFKAWMKGQGVFKGSALQYQEPGTPYPANTGEFGEPRIESREGFYQPNASRGVAPYKIGQAVIGHPEHGNYKAYWDGEKLVSLEEFYRRWESGEFDFKTEKFGSGFMRNLQQAWEAIPKQVTDYVTKGLENNAKQSDLTAEMLSNLPGAPKEVTDFMSRFLDAPDKSDELLDDISRNTQFDRGFLEAAVLGLMMALPGGAKRFNKISKGWSKRLAFEAKHYGGAKPLNPNHLGKPKGLNNPKFPRDTMTSRSGYKPKGTTPVTQESSSRIPEVGVGNQNRRVADSLQKTQAGSNAANTSPVSQRTASTTPTSSAPVRRNRAIDDLVDSQSAKLKGEFDKFAAGQSAARAARAAEYPAHIRKAFKEAYGMEIPKGYKMSAKQRLQLEQMAGN